MVVGQKATCDPNRQGLCQEARERLAGAAGARQNLRQQTAASQNADCPILPGNIFIGSYFTWISNHFFTSSSCGE